MRVLFSPSNRTKVELKLLILYCGSAMISASNRTKVELKQATFATGSA